MDSATKKNIVEFQEKILAWYQTKGRKFPWRKKGLTHYQIVIAEALLQRTRAETVATFFSKFIKDFPNWVELASSDVGILEEYLKPVGLYKQRALRLKSLAIEMVKRKGKIPKERIILEEIPFVGQYIANAIELIIFNQPSPLIDVNMSRVLERYFGSRKMADIRYDPYLQNLSYKVVNHPNSKEINWGILDFAALVCQARKPKCEKCIMQNKCTFFRNELQ